MRWITIGTITVVLTALTIMPVVPYYVLIRAGIVLLGFAIIVVANVFMKRPAPLGKDDGKKWSPSSGTRTGLPGASNYMGGYLG